VALKTPAGVASHFGGHISQRQSPVGMQVPEQHCSCTMQLIPLSWQLHKPALQKKLQQSLFCTHAAP
jgi:hypothetical protein